MLASLLSDFNFWTNSIPCTGPLRLKQWWYAAMLFDDCLLASSSRYTSEEEEPVLHSTLLASHTMESMGKGGDQYSSDVQWQWKMAATALSVSLLVHLSTYWLEVSRFAQAELPLLKRLSFNQVSSNKKHHRTTSNSNFRKFESSPEMTGPGEEIRSKSFVQVLLWFMTSKSVITKCTPQPESSSKPIFCCGPTAGV